MKPLITKVTGGRDGGESRLTNEIQNKKNCTNSFGNVGCVIMASGLGKRFGSNKLMADFHGKPLISHVLDVTEDLFARRIVVTRHNDVADLCKNRGIQTVFHNLPHRSDTVRLGLEKMKEMNRCMFFPGDQPLLKRKTLENLLLASLKAPDSIWRISCNGIPGSPVIFPDWTFPELLNLPEGKGGSFITKKYPERLRMINIQDMYELKDIDSPEDLIQLLER